MDVRTKKRNIWFFFEIFFCRHPFLLYPHFIDHWKKRLNNDDDFLDDSEFEVMFTDEDEQMEEIKKKKKKKKNEKEKKVKNYFLQLNPNFCIFLVKNKEKF